MKLISLTRGMFAVVDDDDFEWVSKIKWHAVEGRSTFYASTNVRQESGRYCSVGMHRMINKTPKGMLTDHEDGNGLNNQKYNLRTATRIQNGRNRLPNKGGTSAHKGVYWDKKSGAWRASIRVNKKLIYIGAFQSEDAAAAAYAKRSDEEFSDFNWRPK